MAQSGTVVGGKFSCPACGKQYAWKAQLAGKKAKCSCGAAVAVPQAPPAAEAAPSPPQPPPPQSIDDLYDFAEAPAAPLTRVATPVVETDRSTAAPRSVGGGKVMVVPQPVASGYPATGRAPDAPRGRSSQIHDVRRDVFLPLALIGAGFLGMIVWALTAAGGGAVGAVVMSIAVGASTLIKTFVIILLALVAAPMFGVSFGDFRTAIAKFAAVIIFTDMGLLWLDEIMDAVAGEATGRGARKLSWLITLLFATAVVSFLVRFLFDMDSEEVGYVAVPLVIASLVIGFVLKLIAVGVLMGMMGAANAGSDAEDEPAGPGPPTTSPVAPAAAGAADATPDAAAPAPPAESSPYQETALDRTIARRLREPGIIEGRTWIERQVLSDEASATLIRGLYAAGARRIHVDLKSSPRATRAFVELPTDPSKRARCFSVYGAYPRTQGADDDSQATKDTGQRFLVVDLKRS